VTFEVKKTLRKDERITQVQLLEKQDICDLGETFEFFAVKKDYQKKE